MDVLTCPYTRTHTRTCLHTRAHTHTHTHPCVHTETDPRLSAAAEQRKVELALNTPSVHRRVTGSEQISALS